MRPRAKISQTTIARDLGLSQALVSKVLNGQRNRIDAKTFELIWAHAVKVGYQGKGITKHAPLTASGHRQIGIVLRAGLQPFMQSNFFSHVQAGLHVALQARGYSTVVVGTEDAFAETGPLPSALVVLGAVKSTFLRTLRQSTRRIVAINGTYPGLCHSVLPNDAQSLELLVEHLATQGHRRFGWIGGLPHSTSHAVRLEALRTALATRGLPVPTDQACAIIPDAADRQEGREAVLELLDRPGARPTAIVCFNGVMCRGATNALLQAGWDIPREISIAAVDATRVCVEETPHITCASAEPEKLGAVAAELLMDSTGNEDENYQSVTLAAQLRLGDTTGPAPK